MRRYVTVLFLVGVMALGGFALAQDNWFYCDAETPCFATGCSGEVCASQPVFTTCVYQDWYACLAYAECVCQGHYCNWVGGAEYHQCMAQYR